MARGIATAPIIVAPAAERKACSLCYGDCCDAVRAHPPGRPENRPDGVLKSALTSRD